VIVVVCAEVNVVRSRRLYPRALLTPFTDNVQLTGGDERAYTAAAKAQRSAAKASNASTSASTPVTPGSSLPPATPGRTKRPGHVDQPTGKRQAAGANTSLRRRLRS